MGKAKKGIYPVPTELQDRCNIPALLHGIELGTELFSLCSSVADPECLSRILIFTHPGSRIPDLGSRIQKQQQKRMVKKNFIQKNVTNFSKMWVWDPGSGKTYFGSRIQGSKRHQIPDPDQQHCFVGCVVWRTCFEKRLKRGCLIMYRKAKNFYLSSSVYTQSVFRIRADQNCPQKKEKKKKFHASMLGWRLLEPD